AQRLVDRGDQVFGAGEVGLAVQGEGVVGVVADQVVLGMLAVAQGGGAVVECVQRRAVVGLDERVGSQASGGDVPGEGVQRKPLRVPLRGVPERGERPDLGGVVVIDPPVGVVVFEQLEDCPVGV